MASITTDLPNLPINLVVDSVALLPEVSRVEIASNRMVAQVSDALSDKKYHEISKQLRILYSLSFEHVYSEDYDVHDRSNGIGYHGHNERKEHLLQESISGLNENFATTAQSIFKDLLETSTTTALRTRFFNLAYIWTRANELEELKLLTEAYVQYWRIFDEMHRRGTKERAIAALKTFGLEENRSNIFAAKVLAGIDREKRKSAEGEIADIAELDRLRHPHAHQAGGRQKYYLEEETHISAEINNWFISKVTKLFILWQLDMKGYYLSPRANIYEIKKAA